MTADALRGADDAQRAVGALGQSPMTPTALEAWMKLWLPQASPAKGLSAVEVSDFHALLENWWLLMGVVPRYRYDELERQYQELKKRLEDSEKTVRRLRRALGTEGGQAEARDMLDAWENLTQETMAAQSEWTRRWLESWTKPATHDETPTEESK